MRIKYVTVQMEKWLLYKITSVTVLNKLSSENNLGIHRWVLTTHNSMLKLIIMKKLSFYLNTNLF